VAALTRNQSLTPPVLLPLQVALQARWLR